MMKLFIAGSAILGKYLVRNQIKKSASWFYYFDSRNLYDELIKKFQALYALIQIPETYY